MIKPGSIVIVPCADGKELGPFRVERLPEGRGYWDMTNAVGQSVVLDMSAARAYGLLEQTGICSFCFEKIKKMTYRFPGDDDSPDAIRVSTVGIPWEELGIDWEDGLGSGGFAHQGCLKTKRKGAQ